MGERTENESNGIRFLAQAAVDAGLVRPPHFTVATAGGLRTIAYRPGPAPGWAMASVDMGPARLGPDQPQEFEDRRARTVDVGNPHLVLLGPDTASVDVAQAPGPSCETAFSGGHGHVEWITPRDRRRQGTLLDFRVWERGVGETLACGTGSVAAAAASRSWGVLLGNGAARSRGAQPGRARSRSPFGAGGDDVPGRPRRARGGRSSAIHPGMLS